MKNEYTNHFCAFVAKTEVDKITLFSHSYLWLKSAQGPQVSRFAAANKTARARDMNIDHRFKMLRQLRVGCVVRLTHIPLFFDQGTTCMVIRSRWKKTMATNESFSETGNVFEFPSEFVPLPESPAKYETARILVDDVARENR